MEPHYPEICASTSTRNLAFADQLKLNITGLRIRHRHKGSRTQQNSNRVEFAKTHIQVMATQVRNTHDVSQVQNVSQAQLCSTLQGRLKIHNKQRMNGDFHKKRLQLVLHSKWARVPKTSVQCDSFTHDRMGTCNGLRAHPSAPLTIAEQTKTC